LPRSAGGDDTVAIQEEDGRGAPDVKSANQVQVAFGVYLDMSDARNDLGDLAEHPARRAAWLAERRRKLQEGGPLPQLRTDVIGMNPVAGGHRSVLSSPAAQQDADRRGHDERRHED
jgi:hypothetical protein